MGTNFDKSQLSDKSFLLDYYRHRAGELLATINEIYGNILYKKRASELNSGIIESKKALIKYIFQKSIVESWSKNDLLNVILMSTYTNYIVMMEARNKVWPYEYMTFSRRIGELWEPFCQLCWEYPVKPGIVFFIPPLFNDLKKRLYQEIKLFIFSLNIPENEKAELFSYYDKVWLLASSGEVNLELDLHFIDQETKYNVDFKSGFSSNEKGNTNRLLLVASIYKILEENHICELYVRSAAERNNHYLQTLKRSDLWNVYCEEEAYNNITAHTGFDLHNWIKLNIDWGNDFSSDMYAHVKSNNLEQYLEW